MHKYSNHVITATAGRIARFPLNILLFTTHPQRNMFWVKHPLCCHTTSSEGVQLGGLHLLCVIQMDTAQISVENTDLFWLFPAASETIA